MRDNYISIYKGFLFDRAVQILLNLDREEDFFGWISIDSSLENKVDLNAIINPGNYVIKYYINGLDEMEVRPLSLRVRDMDGVYYQLIILGYDVYMREFNENTNLFDAPWAFLSDSAAIYKSENPPQLPNPQTLWLKTVGIDGGRPSLNMYDETTQTWNDVTNSEEIANLMSENVYDINKKRISVPKYINDSIAKTIVGFPKSSYVYGIFDNIFDDDIAGEVTIGYSPEYFIALKTVGQNVVGRITNPNTNSWINKLTPFSSYDKLVYSKETSGKNDGLFVVLESIGSDSIYYLPSTNAMNDSWTHFTKFKDIQTMKILNDVVYVITKNRIFTTKDFKTWRELVFGLSITDKWLVQSSGVATNINSIAANDNRCVAVGDNGTILLSTNNGDIWAKRNVSLLVDNLNSVIFANNIFTIVGNNGAILTSSDGDMWEKQTNEITSDLNDIIYADGRYVVVSQNGVIMTSLNGVTWTNRDSGETTHLQSIAYNTNNFIVVGDSGTILTSSDAIIWNKEVSEAVHFRGIIYGNNQYVAVGYSGTIVTSPDGIMWTKRTSNTTNSLQNITYKDGRYTIIGSGGVILTSLDGIEWNIGTSGTTNILYDIICIDNRYIVVGVNGRIATNEYTVKDLEYGNGFYYIIGTAMNNDNVYFRSNNLIEWNLLTLPNEGPWTSLLFGNDTFFVSQENDLITDISLSSTDGINWVSDNIGITNKHSIFGNGIFYDVSNEGLRYFENNDITKLKNTAFSITGVSPINLKRMENYLVFAREDNGKHQLVVLYNNNIINIFINHINDDFDNMDLQDIIEPQNMLRDSNIEYNNNTNEYLITEIELTKKFLPNTNYTLVYKGVHGEKQLRFSAYSDNENNVIESINTTNKTNDIVIVELKTKGTLVDSFETSPKLLINILPNDGVNTQINLDWICLYEADIKNPPLVWNDINISRHITIEEREEFNRKVSSILLGNMANTMILDAKNYTDDKIQNYGLDRIRDQTDNLGLEINLHINDYIQGGLLFTKLNEIFNTIEGEDFYVLQSSIHVAPTDRDFWNNKIGEHTHINDGRVQIQGDDVVSGIIDIDQLPPEVFDRIIIVQSNEIRLALTSPPVYNGDVIRVFDQSIELDEWYKVYDDTKLNSAEGYVQFTKSKENTTVFFNTIENTPTDVSGYGISNLYDKEETDVILDNMIPVIQNHVDEVIDSIDSHEEGKIGERIQKRYSEYDELHVREKNLLEPRFLRRNNLFSEENILREQYYNFLVEERTSGVSDPLNSIIYTNNQYVVVSSYSNVLTSPDSITWTSRTSGISGVTNELYGIVYGNNQYVIVGDDGIILTSPDAITWTSGFGQINYQIYVNNQYIAVGDYGNILTSPDGITWTSRNSGVNEVLNDIIYINDQYVIVGRYGTILTSPDAITWTKRNSGLSNNLYSIIYINNQYVVVGWNGTILTSPDSITWTSRTSGISGVTNELYGIVYGNNQYIAVGDYGTILTSPDSITWTERTSGISSSSSSLRGIIYARNHYVIVGEDTSDSTSIILTSPDGITWTSRTSGVTNALEDIIYFNNLYIVSGSYGTILTSPDGITWTSRTNNSNCLLRGFTINNNILYLGLTSYNRVNGDGGSRVALSLSTTNGITWNNGAQYFGYQLRDIIYANNQYITVGSQGDIYVSDDLILWTKITSGVTSNLFSIIYVNNQYISVGGNGTILTSPDSITWTKRTSGVTRQLNSIIFANNQYVVVGDYGTILTSPDTIVWTQRTSGVNNYVLYSITYGNNQYVIVGDDGIILTSPDSITWTSRTSGITRELNSIIYGINEYIAVGYSGTILSINRVLEYTNFEDQIHDTYLYTTVNKQRIDSILEKSNNILSLLND